MSDGELQPGAGPGDGDGGGESDATRDADANGRIEKADDATTGSVDELAAALRRDAADLDVYAQVLSGSLAEALPQDAVVLARKRTMSDRLAGREGRVERVEISLEDQRLILTLAHGRPTGEVAKVVRGVVLSRTPMPLDEWTQRLAAAVAARARTDARVRAALEKLVLGG
jgi:hypothetical protein